MSRDGAPLSAVRNSGRCAMAEGAPLPSLRAARLHSRAGGDGGERAHRRAPPGFSHVLEVMEGRERIGAMILGGGARVGRGSHLGINARPPGGRGSQKLGVARLVALMRKHVRTWLPGIRLLLAYSDPAAGHTGGIYEADGWAPFGKTTHKRGCGWRSRPNRSDDPVSPKLRWVRTP